MSKKYSESAEAETTSFWDEKARRNTDRPSHAVGVDDPLRNRCIENAQRVVVNRGIRAGLDQCSGTSWVRSPGYCRYVL